MSVTSVTPHGHLMNQSQDSVFASDPRSGVHASPAPSPSGSPSCVVTLRRRGRVGVQESCRLDRLGLVILLGSSLPSRPLASSQSPRMILTKLATSVSLVSWEVKKGCCCRGDGPVKKVLQ